MMPSLAPQSGWSTPSSSVSWDYNSSGHECKVGLIFGENQSICFIIILLHVFALYAVYLACLVRTTQPEFTKS